jgi:hypothetical protein
MKREIRFIQDLVAQTRLLVQKQFSEENSVSMNVYQIEPFYSDERPTREADAVVREANETVIVIL